MFTRTFSTPLDNQDAGNWSCMLGLAALFVETSLLAFSAYAALTHTAVHTVVGQARTSRESPRIVPGNRHGMKVGVNNTTAIDGVGQRLAKATT